KLGLSGLAVEPSTLAPGESGEATASYTLTQADVDAGTVHNEAIASGEDPNGGEVSDDDTEDVDLGDLQEASIALEKSGVLSTDGETIAYTFTVTNNGTVTVDNLTISDTKLGLSDLAVSPSSLAPGESGEATASYTLTQADVDAGTVHNEAIASGTHPTYKTLVRYDTEDVDLGDLQEASIALEKSGALSTDGETI